MATRSRVVLMSVPLLFAGLLAEPAQAQFPLIVNAGPAFVSVSGDDVPDDYGSKTGFFVNVGTALPLGDAGLAIMPFVGFTQRGGADETDDDETLDLSYIDLLVPLAVALPLGDAAELSVGAGPRVSLQVSCKFADDGESDDCEDNKSVDFAVLGDVGISYAVSPTTSVGIGAGYDLGLADIFDNGDVKNRGFYVRGSIAITVGGD